MRVFGTIKDAATDMPISKAKVSLSVGDKELAVLKSDRKGKFEYEEAASYIGETLICQVEKEKYHPQTVTYKIEHDEVPLEIELVKEKNGIPWLKIAAVIGAVIVAGIVVWIIIHYFPGGQPDLAISNIDLSPASPTVNDTITFQVYVKNIGNARAGSSELRFQVGGESSPPVTPVPALDPGREYRHTRRKKLMVIGNIDCAAIADYGNNVAESNEGNNVRIRRFRVTEPPAQPVYSHGIVVIHGTYYCDLDRGRETETGADFFWRIVTSTERYIAPRNGARFHVLGRRDFNSITYSDLRRLPYSSQRINGSNTASNQIPQGTVVAAITSEYRYCKFRINEYGRNLTIYWVTYSRD